MLAMTEQGVNCDILRFFPPKAECFPRWTPVILHPLMYILEYHLDIQISFTEP